MIPKRITLQVIINNTRNYEVSSMSMTIPISRKALSANNGPYGWQKSIVLTAFCLWLFPIVGTKYTIESYCFTYGIPIVCCIYAACNQNNRIFLNKRITTLILLYFLLLQLSFIIPIIYKTYDFTYIWTVLGVVRKLLIYAFLLTLILRVYPSNEAGYYFTIYHSTATFVYVAFSFIFAMLPNLRSIWISIWQFERLDLLESFGYTLRFGWSGFSGFRSTIACSISTAFIITTILKPKDTTQLSKPRLLILLIGNMLGAAFYGRTGVGLCVAMLALSLVMSWRSLPNAIGKVVIVVFMVITLAIIISSISPEFSNWYKWLSTPFKNLLTSGRFNNASYNKLLEEFIFMPKRETLMHGDGWYEGGGSQYPYTDSGFMRQIIFWGIPGMILTYLLVVLSAIDLVSVGEKYLGVFLLSCIIWLEIKGEVYYEFIPLLLVLSHAARMNKPIAENEIVVSST